MAGHRIQRITEDIKRVLPGIMRGMKDPRVNGMLSVVRVEVSGDASVATIYISAMEGLDKAKDAVKGLEHASGYVRNELNQTLQLRKSPELRFIADDSIAYSAEISERLRKLNEGNKEKGDE